MSFAKSLSVSRPSVRFAVWQVVALLAALVLAALFVTAAGRDPWVALAALAKGAFGSWYGFSNVWTKATPLLLTGLAVLFAFRAGFWNIGAEGQFIVGAIVAGWVGTWEGLPSVVHVPLVLVLAGGAGACWCLIPAWLRLARGALEVISTIMLNFVALFLLSWLVHGPLMQASGAQPVGDSLASSATLPRLLGGGYSLHAGVFVALFVVAVGALLLMRTELGFQLRMVGQNPAACRWAGISVPKTIYRAAALSGGFAALGGALEVMGVLGRLFDNVSPGYGYTGIAVALLARLSPWGLLLAALFFGALSAGSTRLQLEADVSHVLVLMIQAVVILASIAPGTALGRRER